MKKNYLPFLLLLVTCCTNRESHSPGTEEQSKTDMAFEKGTFGYDLEFLKEHHPDLIVLHDKADAAQVILLPGYQGRVMTSTSNGKKGASYGWINYDLVGSQTPSPHIHAYGGEERFWLGPEGGQFSIYFKEGDPFTFDHWQVPQEIDTEPFEVLGTSAEEARFEKEMHLTNYSGTSFDVLVNRNIRILDRADIERILGLAVPEGVETVAFESENILTNKGKLPWTKKSGMLSVWILSMLNASDKTTVAIPYRKGDLQKLGQIVTDDYFGKVPDDRLTVGNDLILFKADGKYRSKIGLSPSRALQRVASYDAVNNVLTIAVFSQPEGQADYVNSKWEIQKDPFTGDAINSYNDGPVNGGQMGNLYEIESSSPAAALKPNESLTHYHRTIHLKGSTEALDSLSIKILGIPVNEISL